MQNIALITMTLQGGGAERCAADLSLIFTRKGLRVFIFSDLSVNVEYEYAGILVDYDFGLSSFNQRLNDNSLQHKVNELKRLKSKYNIDIAISFMQYANYLNILSREKEKVILTTHSVNSEYAKYDNSVFWARETFCDLYQYADLITFPSDFCRDDWLRHYGDKNNITRRIYNPVHMMQVNADVNKNNIVIAIGRMHNVKRQWHIIKAFSMVKKMCPDSKLIILGEGELRQKLETVITCYNLENDVEMPGNVKNVQDYLARAKVFVMTSKYEAMPCSVLEALSAGVPVVSCDSPGGIREELGLSQDYKGITCSLKGKCGIMTPYIEENNMEIVSSEEKMLADEIVHLLKDDELRNSMAVAAGDMVQKFSADIIGSVWIDDIFENSLKRNIDQKEFEKIRDKHIADYQKSNKPNINMYISYYRLLEKWMVLHEKGKSVKQYFIRCGIKKIIIYGLGKMAKHLMADIEESDIDVICAIDICAMNKYTDFPVITPDEKIPDADCVVITPIHEIESIKQKLESRTLLPLLSLSDIIDESMQ